MQVLIPCLLILAVENVKLVQNERLDAQEVLGKSNTKLTLRQKLVKMSV